MNLLKGNPDEVTLEVTNRCDLSCVLCAAGRSWMKEELGNMDFDSAIRLLGELRNQTYRIRFSGRGEPILHSRLWDIVKHASDLGIPSYVDTNANVLCSIPPEKVIDSGLKRIAISLDGMTQETYEI